MLFYLSQVKLTIINPSYYSGYHLNIPQIAFDKLRLRLPELVEGNGTTRVNLAIPITNGLILLSSVFDPFQASLG
jgi:hypothetical protein